MIEIRQALQEATQALSNEGVDSPRLDAELLLADTVAANRAWLLAHPDRRLTPKELTRFRDLVARRAAREPLAYILGHREFFGLDLLVDARVLVPRPETELLVERALAWLRQRHRPKAARIADVGAGSGAIAVALAVHLPTAVVYALDASPGPLAVTGENARRHGVEARVHCLQGDLLAPLPVVVDLVAANLPYVATHEWSGLAPEIREHEPRAALDGGTDGLEIIGRLLRTAGAHLAKEGAIVVEIGAGQGAAATALAKEQFPGALVELQRDYAGLDRLAVIVI